MPQARSHSLDTAVDAMSLAARGGEVQQTFAVVDLPRVRDQAVDNSAVAKLRVKFQKVDDRVLIDGEVAAALRLRCQRCLLPVVVSLQDAFNVVIVASESELEQILTEQDAIVAEATRLDLAWLTEEQLLLAVPLVVLHENSSECAHEQPSLSEATIGVASEAKGESQRPFADLRELLKKH
ncbi:MAG: DUF177 domain-containing protein [Candidatus Obscuribacterales bacterium]|nr:DUF177 domain-containing protein [Steroidobacteraceae bacterium]